uniref:Protein tweety homolog n=1 Tax=Panagrolaimus sp. JU765 TaxID=591449 RepID=A0AC34Q576_9BILA
MFLDEVIKLIHRIPHFNFRFRQISNIFQYELSSDYAQSLAIFGIISGLIGFLLLLIITITWICQCCRRKDNTQRSRKSIRNLTLALFIISVFCFVLLGGCLYGNERINRSVGKTVNGLDDVHKNLKLAANQWSLLSKTQQSAEKHVDDLVALIDQKTRESTNINKTLLDEVDSELTLVSDKVGEIKAALNHINITLGDIKKVEKAKLYTDRFEFDRWTFYVILPSIIIAVLFIGVISFCRQSRKGSVTFSALGVVTFIVTWALIAIVVPVTIGHADLCASNDDFIQTHLRPDFYKAYLFYKTCKISEEHRSVPGELPVAELSQVLEKIQIGEAKLVTLLNALFNSSAEITAATQNIANDVSESFKKVGAIESALSCYSMHDDVNDIYNGICHDAVIGSLIMFASTFLLGIFLFILLIVVSKTWYMFNRLPSDYIEVGEDDPFFPRQQDTVIPAEIYGTHVFNHRTRFASNSMEHNDPSTGTTTATNILNQQNSQTTPLLDSTWQRGGTAPLASGNNSVSAATGNRFI